MPGQQQSTKFQLARVDPAAGLWYCFKIERISFYCSLPCLQQGFRQGCKSYCRPRSQPCKAKVECCLRGAPFCRTQPTLPQPQYWRLSNHSITSIVSADQPGYAWTSEARSGAVVSGALPSGMLSQQARTLLYIQPAMPIHSPHMLCLEPGWCRVGVMDCRERKPTEQPMVCIVSHPGY